MFLKRYGKIADCPLDKVNEIYRTDMLEVSVEVSLIAFYAACLCLCAVLSFAADNVPSPWLFFFHKSPQTLARTV